MSFNLTHDEIADSVAALPAFPGVVMDILEILNDENAGIESLVERIQHDAVIVGQVLSAANRSDRYRQGKGICDIHKAVLLLGSLQIREIALSVSLMDYMVGLGRDARFAEHGLAVGLCAQELSRHSGLDRSSALVAGLLHDIGRIWLIHRYPRAMQRFTDLAAANERPVREIEHELFGLDHAEIGNCIAQAWGLPEELCAGIAQHHQLRQQRPSPLVAATHLAETLGNALELPGRDYDQVIAVDPTALQVLGLDWARDVGDLLGRVEARFQAARATMVMHSNPAK